MSRSGSCWTSAALVLGALSCAPSAERSEPAGERASSSEEHADSALAAEPSDSLRAEIVGALERYYDDFSARDWAAFAGHFWPGATLTTVWQPAGEPAPRVVATTIPEFVAKAHEGPGSKAIFEEHMTGARVRVTGNLAQVWARYTVRFGDSTDVATWEGIDAFTLMQHEGRWRIVSLAYTDLPE